MKTLKLSLAIFAVLFVTGSAFAGPGEDVRKSVREKIATAIQSADLNGQGEVLVKFGISEKSDMQILKVESADMTLSKNVKEALDAANLIFPKGSKGTYQIKVYVNETANLFTYDMVRNQVMDAIKDVQSKDAETVQVKFRVIDASTVQVLKAESPNKGLNEEVKKAIETQSYLLPKKLNGEYNLKITFK
ncbi:MAG: hypothetical protein HC830_02670 [Bacteroidetes bacterium]|nr:hypothetical protein [Bacteroidota bacterium]